MAQQVKLASVDEQEFTVSIDVAKMSETIKHMVEGMTWQNRIECGNLRLPDIGADQTIPLPNVTGKILQKVIAYCQYHLEHPTPVSEEKKDEKRTDDISPWDLEFCKVDQATLFELILAANYLDIRPLLDLTCKTVANMIKGTYCLV